MGLLHYAILAIGLLHGLAHGKPTPIHTYNATYDDVPALFVSPLLNPLATYDGLMYSNTFVNNISLSPVGLTPQSSPNIITVGLPGTALGFSVYYTGSKVLAFDFQKFYFACVLSDGNGVASVAEACTVQVDGYRTSGDTQKRVATAKFTFLPPTNPLILTPPLALATLPVSFLAVQNVTVTPIVATGGTATIAVVLDSLLYTTYNSTSK